VAVFAFQESAGIADELITKGSWGISCMEHGRQVGFRPFAESASAVGQGRPVVAWVQQADPWQLFRDQAPSKIGALPCH
jgi:hypothetical protein